ncbi:G patch domain-containing protein TGH homolog isoform X2 [Ananas comosus]|uniref:G patch domain-containing protein TGH homolog n=1 Tax=Ananas comosus TaxID=4615 RepID=A0A6P5F5A9_ANACO|nr:G patch domain-containing protein TGH homolog isoform X2 [Ananas comosus]
MDEGDEDYVVYGTPIEREEETSARKRRAIADAGQLRALPPWKQEVRDEEGRRRFHGAFTGGFSAGYYNTAGSKEGWTPQTFTSSRKNRADVKQQSIYNFLDEDDIKDMGGRALETSMQFDTFGFTAAELARKEAEKEQEKRPSAIPGPVPDEIVRPAANSIGIKLLMKMGWRQGRSIKDTHADSLYESRREARKAFLAFSRDKDGPELAEIESSRSESEKYPERSDDIFGGTKSTPVYVLNPKQDLHGLGYDPFKHAPEFRDRKRSRESRDKDRGNNKRKYAPGFGIGALEELDIEDEDIYASGFDFEQMEVEEVEPTKMIGDSWHKLVDRKRGSMLSFKVASNSDYVLERFRPPVIPADFESRHKFPTTLESTNKFPELPPPEVPPPEDNNLRLLIEGSAAMVARCGKSIEDLYKEKSKTNQLFLFLSGGEGHNYYERKLWEQKQKRGDLGRQNNTKSMKSSDEKMNAENRGKVLGERPLDRSSKASSLSVDVKEVIHLQSNLGDTFIKPVGLSESLKPFKYDPAKQERFEQFLREKYHGGLRAAQPFITNIMSETDRARERLDFEAAAEAIEKGTWSKEKETDPLSILKDLPFINDQRFVSSTEVEKHGVSKDEQKVIHPKREEFEWRPSPILCKRFDLIDPFMGKLPPVQRPRSRMDSLIFMTETIKSSKSEEAIASTRDSILLSHSESKETEKQLITQETDAEPIAADVQRPVDLYKAIFSDDSDDDDADEGNSGHSTDPVKTNEGANMTLNRLVAGDFLESLGKELGLEVPTDKPGPPDKPPNSILVEAASKGDINSSSVHEKLTSQHEEFDRPMEEKHKDNISKSADNVVTNLSINQNEESKPHSRHQRSRSRTPDSDSSDDYRDKKRKTHSRRRRSRSPSTDSSSDRHRSKRNRSKATHRKRGTTDTDSSSDHLYRDRSKSEGKSRKRSRHHKHRRKDGHKNR